MPGEPAAFMSYVRFNDQHDNGQLSQFRERLSAEIQAQTGEEFLIFQDHHDIAWGQHWQRRIEEALDTATLLLVVITPSLFRSAECRGEISRFVQREAALGRSDLILPIYYISAWELDDPAMRDGDEIAQTLASRQHADWRELRFEPFTSPVVRKAIAQLAARMRDTFWQRGAPSPRPARPPGPDGPDGSSPGSMEPASDSAQAVEKTLPPTYVVDAHYRGDYTTISAAIAAAEPGYRIRIRPGVYEESLVVDKPLEIQGDGLVSDIEIRASGANALLFKASIGRVSNLTLRQTGKRGSWFGVNITQGRLDLEGCDISSRNLACVAIRNGADPRLRHNRIHGGRQSGVFVLDGGLGTLEDNEITGNALAGVEIKTGGNPTLRRNRIHEGRGGGVYVQERGLGTLEDNDITGNALAGVEITTGGNPTLRANRISRHTAPAIYVHDGGGGVIEDNDLTGNARGAWYITNDCADNVIRVNNQE